MRLNLKVISLMSLIFLALLPGAIPLAGQMPLLKVSEDHRYLVLEDGTPFFWLGDTGWLLFAKLNREEAVQYLDDRAEKGFNVIQVMLLHQLRMTNVYDDSALIGGDLSRPLVTSGKVFDKPAEYDYWDHVDYIIRKAEERGIYMALVPVWGSNVRSGAVSIEQADAYARWLAERYSGQSNIIWINGGDVRGDDHKAVWERMGSRLKQMAPDQLVSFHPFGRTQSSQWFHHADWLDFNMFQSGHRRYDQDDTELSYGEDNWRYVQDDYLLVPTKPTLDGEPSYEGIPQGLHDPSQPYWEADDVRRYAYWSVYNGACGFTYGHNAVMQMHKPEDKDPSYGVREYWFDALDAPGAFQVVHLKDLMLSKPYLERIPDPSLIASGQGIRYDYQAATRGREYAFIYTFNGRDIDVSMGRIVGDTVRASWFNPRDGEVTEIGEFENSGSRKFDPPGEIQEGNDWVLVLESMR